MDCLITWHSFWDLVLFVILTWSLLKCLFIHIICHFDSEFSVRLKNGSCPFLVWTTKVIFNMVLGSLDYNDLTIHDRGRWLFFIHANAWCDVMMYILGKPCYWISWKIVLWAFFEVMYTLVLWSFVILTLDF